MSKSLFRFAAIVAVSQIVTYFVAGVIAQVALGANEFYPPSPQALSYLRDPHDIPILAIVGAQALRGLLFALVLYPFWEPIRARGAAVAALAIGGIVLVLGYVAASGGLIEHFVFFTPAEYPVKFAAITLIEIVIQTLALGWLVVTLEQRFVGWPAEAQA